MSEQHVKDHGARRQDGQALVEYSLIIGLVALVCFAAVQGLGASVSAIIQNVAGAL